MKYPESKTAKEPTEMEQFDAAVRQVLRLSVSEGILNNPSGELFGVLNLVVEKIDPMNPASDDQAVIRDRLADISRLITAAEVQRQYPIFGILVYADSEGEPGLVYGD